MAEKKSDFVVTDRRRFGAEGETRPDAPVAEEEKSAPPTPKQATPPAATPAGQQSAVNAQAPAGEAQPTTGKEEELPVSPTPQEQHEQSEAYKASGKKIDDMIAAAGKSGQGPLEMNFERVIESFYMSALIQMGAIRQ